MHYTPEVWDRLDMIQRLREYHFLSKNFYAKTDRLLHRSLALPEKVFLRSLKLQNHFPPLFLVGPPRSGTTVMYLHIVNTFHVAYFPNISKYHPHACVTYALLGRMFARKYSPTYDNVYGILHGSMAPSDGWEILARWFPTYNLSQPIREKRLYELKNVVCFFERFYNAPFLNRNIGNSIRIRTLNMLFPDALFVQITRNLPDAVFSLLEARKHYHRDLNQWWCTPPPQFYNNHFDTELEQTVSQVWGLTDRIQEDLASISPKRWLTISYESFCRTPEKLVNWVRSKYQETGVSLKLRNTSRRMSFQQRSRIFEGRPQLEKRVAEIVEYLERGI